MVDIACRPDQPHRLLFIVVSPPYPALPGPARCFRSLQSHRVVTPLLLVLNAPQFCIPSLAWNDFSANDKQLGQKLIESYDTNGDGVLQPSEFAPKADIRVRLESLFADRAQVRPALPACLPACLSVIGDLKTTRADAISLNLLKMEQQRSW